MTQSNKYDKSGIAAQKGNSSMNSFLEQYPKHGWQSHRISSEHDDKVNHIDIHLYKEGEEIHVDVKSHKSWEKDGPLAIGWLLLEHTNIIGAPGWLRSKNTHIAFEQKIPNHGFIVVKREDLLKLWEEKVDMEKTASKSIEALYRVYTRTKWKRKDIISWVKVEDVMALPSCEFWKIE